MGLNVQFLLTPKYNNTIIDSSVRVSGLAGWAAGCITVSNYGYILKCKKTIVRIFGISVLYGAKTSFSSLPKNNVTTMFRMLSLVPVLAAAGKDDGTNAGNSKDVAEAVTTTAATATTALPCWKDGGCTTTTPTDSCYNAYGRYAVHMDGSVNRPWKQVCAQHNDCPTFMCLLFFTRATDISPIS